MSNIRDFRELRVFQSAMDAAMEIFQLSKDFPSVEKYALVDQMRRASRSVCANIAEAWRKRRYKAHFMSKLSDAEAEAEETRVWIQFASRCDYIDEETAESLDREYDRILGQLVHMISNSDHWVIR